jgi:hypothetical protein
MMWVMWVLRDLFCRIRARVICVHEMRNDRNHSHKTYKTRMQAPLVARTSTFKVADERARIFE